MHLLVTVACPRANAQIVAREVLSRRLAACVNTLDGMHSTYWWKGKLESADESLLLIKTTADLYERLEKTVKLVHPYETPEIVAYRIERGSPEYLDWISKETKPTSKRPRISSRGSKLETRA